MKRIIRLLETVPFNATTRLGELHVTDSDFAEFGTKCIVANGPYPTAVHLSEDMPSVSLPAALEVRFKERRTDAGIVVGRPTISAVVDALIAAGYAVEIPDNELTQVPK